MADMQNGAMPGHGPGMTENNAYRPGRKQFGPGRTIVSAA